MAYFPFQPGQQPMSSSQGVVVASDQSPIAVKGSVAGGIFPISGSVAAVIVGTPNVNTAGSVVAFQGTTPWANTNVGSIITVSQGSVAVAIISGSIAATFTPPANQSVSGTVGASIIGLPPFVIGGSTNASVITVGTAAANQSVSGTVQVDVRSSVAVAIISGSIAATFTPPANQSVSGTVNTLPLGTIVTSLVSTIPSSVLVGASIFGTVPVTQVTSPWIVVSSIAGGIFPVSGSVAATITNTNVNVSGSVVAFQGTSPFVTNFQNSSILAVPVGSIITVWGSPSIVGTYSEDAAHTTADKGIFVLAVRNDTVASTASADADYTIHAVDSAGRVLMKPFAAEESRIEGYNSVVSGSVTTLVAAAGTGLRNYITDIWLANTGSVSTLVTFVSGGGASVLGYTVAPAGGGSNIIGLAVPIRTGANATFDMQATVSTSVLYGTVKGFKAP